MAIKDTFHKTLVYFGLAEEHDVDSWDESAPTKAESRNSREARGTVTRFPQRSRRDEIDDIFGDDDAGDRRPALRPVESRKSDARVHFVAPKSFNDAQDVAGSRSRRTGTSARIALPRWLIASFSSLDSSALVRRSPSGTKIGS